MVCQFNWPARLWCRLVLPSESPRCALSAFECRWISEPEMHGDVIAARASNDSRSRGSDFGKSRNLTILGGTAG
jgi:hypothetical protein